MIRPEEKNVPKILLEFLVYGTEDKKPQVTRILDELQKQQSETRAAAKRMRILWYMDKGEMTDEEKKSWFLENKKCKYHIFIDPGFIIPKNYVKDCLTKIRLCENSIKNLKGYGILISENKKSQESYAEVIED
tara:strand:+ start:6307 stop:6705 length:399 start_codon:yes stop_codon:yes gene_type:complete